MLLSTRTCYAVKPVGALAVVHKRSPYGGLRRSVQNISAVDIGKPEVARVRSDAMVCQAAGRRESVFLFGFGGGNDYDEEEEEFTVCKLQVGMFGDINKWQSKLDDIATKYHTDDPEELHSVFKDSLMLVLRNIEYVGYSTSGGKLFDNIEEAEQKFNSVLLEERLKFKEETLVNVDGRRKTRSLDVKGKGDGLDRWLCMTMLMCVEGKLKIPRIDSAFELKKVLTSLGGLGVDDLVAFELLWTPQEADDWYSKEELLADYPTMTTLS